MGAATTGIGLLPTYATAGVIAPVLLIVLRFAQGFAVGGQWGGAALLAIENAPHNQRGLFGSFGKALKTSVTFVSQAALDNPAVAALGLAKPLPPVWCSPTLCS